MPDSARSELLSIQKKLWRHNKSIIDSSVSVNESGFARYERTYMRAVCDYDIVSNHHEMLASVKQADIIYVGDYHTCNQSQRSFLRILKACIKQKRAIIVGMELLHEKYQKDLDKYLLGKISERTFISRVKLKEHWVFDLWNNFKPIFDFCKYHDIPVRAIDAAAQGADVRTRDDATATLLADIKVDYPDHQLFCFIGDLHIAPSHLPKKVTQALKKQHVACESLMLYQNSESIYWKLAEEKIENFAEIVKLADGNFCRMHTPPVIEQSSYLNWLEHEEGEIDFVDAKAQFLELVDQITHFLRLDVSDQKNMVEVFTTGDLSFLDYLCEHGFNQPDIDIIKNQILASESYYISKAKIVYLANLSINHAAEEASHFIKHLCSGDEEARDFVDAFYANILHEALGFFGSKIINHKRKCAHLTDLNQLLDYLDSIEVPDTRMLEYETACAVTEYLRMEKKNHYLSYSDMLHMPMELFVSITHAMGYMLGDKMFYGLLKHRISKKDIRELYLNPWRQEGDSLRIYKRLRRRVGSIRVPKRM